MERAVKKVVKEVKKEERRDGELLRKKRKPRRRNRGGGGGGAPVSTGARISSKQTVAIRERGTDRFAHFPSATGKEAGTLLLDVEVGVHSFPRLKVLAGAYQRYRFKRLEFRFVSMVPSTFSGGYIAAFIPDVTDRVGTGDAMLSRLLAAEGAKATKIWQNMSLVHTRFRDTLYTSDPPSGDQRLYSPGRIAIGVDSKVEGPTSMATPMTVYVDWEVELMEPSIEGATNIHPTGAVFAEKNFYSRSAQRGLWYKDDQTDPASAIPGIKEQIYQLKSSRFASFASQAGNYDRVKYVKPTKESEDEGFDVCGLSAAPGELLIVGFDGQPITEVSDKNYWFIEQGDMLVPVEKQDFSTGLEFLCLRSTEDSLSSRPEVLAGSR